MLGPVGSLRLFLWQPYLFNMYFSRCKYYSLFSCRVLLQKHFSFAPMLSSVQLNISGSSLGSPEDPELLSTLYTLETLSGQKSKLMYVDSKYVGTTKRVFFLSKVTLNSELSFFLLDQLILLYFPNFQRRFGRLRLNLVSLTARYTVC